MSRRIKFFFESLTFERQIGIAVAAGILLLALLSSMAASWQVNERVRSDLVEQGRRVAESLARQSSLALLTGASANAEDVVNATMAFPGVVGVRIFEPDGKTLVVRGDMRAAEPDVQTISNVGAMRTGIFDATASQMFDSAASQMFDSAGGDAWLFVAPVYSQPTSETPFGEAPEPTLLGRVAVVMSKSAMGRLTNDIFVTNLMTSFSFALLFLLLIRMLSRNMAKPLDVLSASMARAQLGQTGVRAEPGGPKDIAFMAHAFNEMMEVMEEREASLRIAAIAFETEEGMLVTDAQAVIIRVNQAFTNLTGYTPEEAIGRKPSMLKSNRHGDKFYHEMWEALRRENRWQGEIWNRRKNGEIYPEWLNITAVLGKDGNVTHYVGSFIDFTERKQAEYEIHQLAFFDSLSQLPNRRSLLDRLPHAVAAGNRNGTGGALLFVDLDNFKTLNDTRGHAVGDLLLVEVSRRLKTCVREGDMLARFGGDEFVLLLEGLSGDRKHAAVQANVVGEKVLAALSAPYNLDGFLFHSSSSVGITLFVDFSQGADELLKQADTAMYEAKRSGRNTLRFFDPAMQESLEARAHLEAGLQTALQQQQFRLYCQLQVDAEGHAKGGEVLLRWVHPEKGIVSPLDFIPLAEDSGLILPIGRWVLHETCRQLKQWEQTPELREMELAINVSVRQFRQPGFVDEVIAAVDRFGINPKRLKLELTESVVLDDIKDAIIKMQALRQVGVSFSMDDFGTGYSSLSYLIQLPLNQLKIDKSFVQHIGGKATGEAIIQTIIGMAHNLNMEVLAEGVETVAQRDFLLANGCALYQGYLFGRPVPIEEFGK